MLPVHLFSLLKWNGTVRPVAVVIKKIYISFGIDRLCSLLCVAVIPSGAFLKVYKGLLPVHQA